MSDYHIDMGFDWDSEPKGGFDGFLQLGLVVMAGGRGSDASLAEMHRGDTLEFYFYDVSEQTAARTVQLPSAPPWIEWSNADANTPRSSPFSGAIPSNVSAVSVGSGTSTVFGGPFPSWAVKQGNNALSLRLAEAGNYFFTLRVQVGLAGTTKTFGVDPQMIVKP